MMPPRLLGRPATWASAALATHLLLLAFLPAAARVNESTDFRDSYAPVARHLLAGDGFVDTQGRPAVRYPPGFSVVLAVVFAVAAALPGDEGLWLGVFDAVAIAVTGALVFLLARRVAGERAAPWAAALWVVYPPFLWLGKQPNSETPFLPLMLGAILAWLAALDRGDQRSAWLAGALAGLATLIRPVTLLLAVPLAISALVRHRGPEHRRTAVRLALAVVAAQALVLLPWELWVHHATGRWLPVSSAGRLAILDGLTFAVDPAADRDAVPAPVATLMDEIEANRRSIGGPVDAARFLADRARDQPEAVAGLLTIKAARAWYGTESMRRERALLAIQAVVLGLVAVGWWLGRAARGRHGRRPVLLVVLVVGYFWGMTWLVLSILRYMVPAMALLVPFAGEALATAFEAVRRRPR